MSAGSFSTMSRYEVDGSLEVTCWGKASSYILDLFGLVAVTPGQGNMLKQPVSNYYFNALAQR